MKIKIGDEIVVGNRRGEVSSIQICRPAEKYGYDVDAVETTEHLNGTITYGRYWCYFDQVRQVLSK